MACVSRVNGPWSETVTYCMKHAIHAAFLIHFDAHKQTKARCVPSPPHFPVFQRHRCVTHQNPFLMFALSTVSAAPWLMSWHKQRRPEPRDLQYGAGVMAPLAAREQSGALRPPPFRGARHARPLGAQLFVSVLFVSIAVPNPATAPMEAKAKQCGSACRRMRPHLQFLGSQSDHTRLCRVVATVSDEVTTLSTVASWCKSGVTFVNIAHSTRRCCCSSRSVLRSFRPGFVRPSCVTFYINRVPISSSDPLSSSAAASV